MANQNLLSAAAQSLIDKHRQQAGPNQVTDTADTAAPVPDQSFSDIEASLGGGAGTEVAVAAAPGTALAALYSHQAMVDLILANPGYSHAQLAAHFGKPESWLSLVLANSDFQATIAPYRSQIADPYLTATMEERFRALTLRSVTVLQKKLESAAIPDMTVLKAAEIGVKALGMGQVQAPPPVQAGPAGAEAVANRILEAMARAKGRSPTTPPVPDTVDAEFTEVKNGS